MTMQTYKQTQKHTHTHGHNDNNQFYFNNFFFDMNMEAKSSQIMDNPYLVANNNNNNGHLKMQKMKKNNRKKKKRFRVIIIIIMMMMNLIHLNKQTNGEKKYGKWSSILDRKQKQQKKKTQ